MSLKYEPASVTRTQRFSTTLQQVVRWKLSEESVAKEVLTAKVAGSDFGIEIESIARHNLCEALTPA